MDYIKTWGLYQCFQGTDDKMVDSDCREDFFALQPNGKVFQCISAHGNMITLKYGEKVFRVNPKLYKIVREPLYKVGDKVEIVEKSIVGQIADVNWHIKDDIPFYFLEVGGKKSGKRYKDYDLREVN